jgi:putative peptide zinc metalloprotease protein
LRAPYDGELHALDHPPAAGVWEKSLQPLGMLVNPGRWVVDAYVAEADLGRLAVGQPVRVRQLIDPPRWIDGRIESVDVSRTLVLPTPMLDATRGGPIPTVKGPATAAQAGVPVVRDALFRVRVALDEPVSDNRLSVVRVRIEGEPEALLMRVLRRAASIFIRESGF